jgi:GNAT superfamily N-acetyltransferase
MVCREASRDDLEAVLHLLAEGQVAARREALAKPTAAHVTAFEAILRDPNQSLVCAVVDETVVGTMQLTFIPGLARQGAWRMQIEAMRVSGAHRGHGLGFQMMRWAFDRASDRGCALVQLTSDASRNDAHRFYERLGFEPSHVGFKLWLSPAADGTAPGSAEPR